jgi:hypothetical protein
MKCKRLSAGFIIPARPVVASRPPSGADWAHEIKHDGYRLIVRRNGPTVRLYTRSAYDWTARLPAIAAAAELIKAKSFTIDGEAVVLGPDGLSRFEELRRRCGRAQLGRLRLQTVSGLSNASGAMNPRPHHLECSRRRQRCWRRNSDSRFPKAGLAAVASRFLFGVGATDELDVAILSRTGPV